MKVVQNFCLALTLSGWSFVAVVAESESFESLQCVTPGEDTPIIKNVQSSGLLHSKLTSDSVGMQTGMPAEDSSIPNSPNVPAELTEETGFASASKTAAVAAVYDAAGDSGDGARMQKRQLTCPSGYPKLCSDGTCAPSSGVCCGGGEYCPAGTTCGSGTKCILGGSTCPSSYPQKCGDGTCATLGAVCCGGGVSCPSGTICDYAGCRRTGSSCSSATPKLCGDGSCVPSGADCCGGGKYCPAGSTCSGDKCNIVTSSPASTCTVPGYSQDCNDGTCAPTGYVCCGDGSSCPPGKSCAGDVCLATGDSSCRAGYTPCPDGCKPAGGDCCGDKKYCPAGYSCVGTTMCIATGESAGNTADGTSAGNTDDGTYAGSTGDGTSAGCSVGPVVAVGSVCNGIALLALA